MCLHKNGGWVEHRLPINHYSLVITALKFRTGMEFPIRNRAGDMPAPSVDTDKLSYEIFSILETKFLFGYEDRKLWIPKSIPPAAAELGGNEMVSPSPAVRRQRRKVCVLSIDGGGMRGVLSGRALAYLEQALKRKSGDPDARIADYFDIAAGSGAGGIFTAMLFGTKAQGRPLFDAEEAWRFLAEKVGSVYSSENRRSGGIFRRIFRSRAGSATAGLEKAMKEAFTDEKTGRSLTLKDTVKPILIPCYDLTSTAPFLFSRADALETDGFDFRLGDVCRGTAAEPGVFEPVPVRSVDGSTRCVAVDGGLAMSNPTAAAITHVLHNKHEFPWVRGVEDILVLSIGTGQVLEGRFGAEEVKGWSAKEWARPMARISGECSAELVDHAVAMAFGGSRRNNYVRIQANGSSTSVGRRGVDLDWDSGPKNTKLMVEIGEEMLKQKNVESVMFGGKIVGEESNMEKLDWFAAQLVQEHLMRRS